MGALATGSVVLVAFPFSDLSGTKMRPAVVLAQAGKNDWILCQVTSNPYADAQAVKLVHRDFAHGSLKITSYARPGKLFTAHSNLIRSEIGRLKAAVFAIVLEETIRVLRGK